MPTRPPVFGKPKGVAVIRRATGWSKRESRQARGYGRAHDLMRAQVLSEEPLCRECSRAGRVSPAVIADHVTPKAEGGGDDRTNYQGLCRPCHKAKTARESSRGKARARR